MTEKEKPSYYSITPASVRYDERLYPNAKLLYGEITALTNSKGYCWATNKYFAELYKVNKKTVSSWIRQLKEYGYINIFIKYKDGSKEVESRYIRISDLPSQEIMDTPIREIMEDNTTSINNTNNTIPKPPKQPPSPLAIELSTLTLNKAVEHGYKLSSITNKEINNGATFVDKLINTLTKSKHTQKESEQIVREIITFAVTDVSNNGEFCWSKNFRSCGSLFTKSKANGQAKWENIYASMNKQPKKEVKQYYPALG